MFDPLSDFQLLTIMLSSRCSDTFKWKGKAKPLSELRIAIKKEIEAIAFDGKKVFEVWIHEDESGGHSWDKCMIKARQCDIFLALCNGNGGWDGVTGSTSRLGKHVGICHAELDEAYHRAPDKVRLIHLREFIDAEPGSADCRFQKYLAKLNNNAAQAMDGGQAISRAKDLAVAALMKMARSGAASGSKGAYFAGEALEWSRMNFQARRETTRRVLMDFLRNDREEAPDSALAVVHPIGDARIAFVCDCIPASLGTAAARELVGQPFLSDWKTISQWPEETHGPVHLIACQKGVTEGQAIRQLGFPDATVVSGPFGVWVADPIQCIQMVFLPNCRDEISTCERLQRFLMWLTEQKEDRLLAARAYSRRRICDVISEEKQQNDANSKAWIFPESAPNP